MSDRLQTSKARISIVGAQPAGFGELAGGTLCLPIERTARIAARRRVAVIVAIARLALVSAAIFT
jgi:hypothetical protein